MRVPGRQPADGVGRASRLGDTVVRGSQTVEVIEARPDRSALNGRALCVVPGELGRRVLERRLRDFGLSVRAVGSAREAFDELEVQSVAGVAWDLVIVDSSLEGGSGLELVHRIRTRWAERSPALLGLAAPHDENFREEGRRGGLRGVVSKPWSDEELRRATSEALAVEALDESRAAEPED